MHFPGQTTLRPAWCFLLIALALPSSARAGAMYHVTVLGAIDPIGLDDQGQVYASVVPKRIDPNGFDGSVRFDSYGPDAGQYINVANNQPLTSAGDFSGQTPTAGVESVNSAGQAIVFMFHHEFPWISYSLTDGTTTTAIPLAPVQGKVMPTGPLGVTPAGQVVWSAVAPTSADPSNSTVYPHTVLYDGKTLVDIGSLGKGWAAPVSVSTSGAVAGNSLVASGTHGFLYQQGTMTDLGTLGGDNSRVQAVNNLGQVVGTSETFHSVVTRSGLSDLSAAPTSHAFLYANGQMADLGVLPGTSYSKAMGINDKGQVVGFSGSFGSQPNQMSAFLYDGKKMLDLNNLLDPASHFKIASGLAINDNGQILAQGFYGTGDIPYTLLLTPTDMPAPPDLPFQMPETSPLVLFGLLLGGLVVRRVAAGTPRPEGASGQG